MKYLRYAIRLFFFAAVSPSLVLVLLIAWSYDDTIFRSLWQDVRRWVRP